MIIRGLNVDVDYRLELEEYLHLFKKAKIYNNKLIACSPFRYENKPSFAVNLENGLYIDSGCTDFWYKGNFIKLLSFLRGETYIDTENYLLEKYNGFKQDVENLKLTFELSLKKEKVFLEESILNKFKKGSNYLLNRGVTIETQKMFDIRYDENSKAVVFPVRDRKGKLVNIKFRKVKDKRFWYLDNANPIKNYVYGLDKVIQGGYKEVYIVEGEVDALYLWGIGKPAIATFGASLSEKQKYEILNSPIEVLIIAVDNDKVGRNYRDKLIDCFSGLLNLKEIVIPEGYKDVNELDLPELTRVCSNLQNISLNIKL